MSGRLCLTPGIAPYMRPWRAAAVLLFFVAIVAFSVSLAIAGPPASASDPAMTITAGPANATNQTTATFTFDAPDAAAPAAQYECIIDDSAWLPCASPRTYTGLAEGMHTFTVRPAGAGSRGDSLPATITWMIDLTPPETIMDARPPRQMAYDDAVSGHGPSATFRFHGVDQTAHGVAAGIDHFECLFERGDFVACSSPRTYHDLPRGWHAFQVRAVDVAGNHDGSPVGYTWYVRPPPTRTATATPYPTPGDGCVQPVVRVDAGASRPFIDHLGNEWQADQAYRPGLTAWGYVGGASYSTRSPIAGALDPEIYQSERWWPATNQAGYRFAVPNGDYKVILHVAEIYPWISTGLRVFDVRLENQPLIQNLDVLALAGPYHASVLPVNIHVGDNELTLDVAARAGSAALNAIEVYRINRCEPFPTPIRRSTPTYTPTPLP